MVEKIDTALVTLWGEPVGAVAWFDEREYAIFEYHPDFLSKGMDISPVHMGIEDARQGDGKFSFPNLNKETFLGLPGLLADALPDRFGSHIMDAWLARHGRDSASLSPVERLCYTGKRGMGALEFEPASIDNFDKSVPIEISGLTNLVREVMNEKGRLEVELSHSEKENSHAILDILRVGTSAGGARAKAVIAMDDQGNIRSGQTLAPPGYDYWILKFDGVTDMELGEPKGYGRIEYAYYLMAKAAGIQMTECRLLEENNRAHFMTKRFDRVNGNKLHIQTLCGMAHYDYNQAGAYSYEQAFLIMRKLRMSKAQAAQQFRRMVFNVVARNLDDHTKNISFIMTTDGKWKLSPAYDVTFAHNPAGKWTSQHQMSANGKRDQFNRKDLIAVSESISLSRPEDVIDEVITAIERWPDYARAAGINNFMASEVSKYLHIQPRAGFR